MSNRNNILQCKINWLLGSLALLGLPPQKSGQFEFRHFVDRLQFLGAVEGSPVLICPRLQFSNEVFLFLFLFPCAKAASDHSTSRKKKSFVAEDS
jgi:hypothetical protein